MAPGSAGRGLLAELGGVNAGVFAVMAQEGRAVYVHCGVVVLAREPEREELEEDFLGVLAGDLEGLVHSAEVSL